MAINCGAIPSELLESLLFGHKKGSFTGAHRDQTGKFEMARGGTLFLDEIGDLDPRLQVKLLRVLQEKRIDPIGSRHPVDVDVRILAATHQNLELLKTTGKFREDLFYRLAEVTLHIPSLRERPCDLPLLAAEILAEVAPKKQLSQASQAWLESQPWPGNVRELQSSLRRAAILATDEIIQTDDFQKGVARPAHGTTDHAPALPDSLQGAKRRAIVERLNLALAETGGHRKQTADRLGITVRTLFRYLDQYKDELTPLTAVTSSRDMDVI